MSKPLLICNDNYHELRSRLVKYTHCSEVIIHDQLMAWDASQAATPPSQLPVIYFEILRSAGKLISDAGRADLINESAIAASKILYTAFHTAQLNTHINFTFEMEPGQTFRLKFEKIDPLV